MVLSHSEYIIVKLDVVCLHLRQVNTCLLHCLLKDYFNFFHCLGKSPQERHINTLRVLCVCVCAHRSWLSPFKERSEKYDLVSHDSPPPIHAERYKKKQSSCTLAKNLHEHEDEEKEEEQAKPLPHDTTAAADCHA